MSRAERAREASRGRARPPEGRAAAATAAARGRGARAHGEALVQTPRGARPGSRASSAHALFAGGSGREVCCAQAQCEAKLCSQTKSWGAPCCSPAPGVRERCAGG